MDKKLIGILCGSYSMIAVLIYLLCGFFGNLWDKAWIVFVISGIACAMTSMIGGYAYDRKQDSKDSKKK